MGLGGAVALTGPRSVVNVVIAKPLLLDAQGKIEVVKRVGRASILSQQVAHPVHRVVAALGVLPAVQLSDAEGLIKALNCLLFPASLAQ